MVTAVFLLAIAFVLALLLWAHAERKIARSGIPQGSIVSQDSDRRREIHHPIVSHRYGLVGKPDYLVETTEGLVPVELKSRDSRSSGPYCSDIAQVAAYCVLVEDATGIAPPYAIIQYANGSWRIQYMRQAREQILQVIDEMRNGREAQSIHRNHTQPGRCRACGFRDVCDERIG
ncbi:MAG: Dna2/Cas4 domain-containing protein [Bryobacteraceae bacterium]